MLKGQADAALLATYDEERRPVARFTMEQALLRMAHPALHWDHTRAAERERLGIANQDVVHLGYRYVSEAIIAPCPDLPSLEHVARDLDGSPGSRLPHVWVERQGARISTLDLVAGRFTLLAGPAGNAWCRASAEVAAETGIELAAYRLAPDGDVVAPPDVCRAAAGIAADGAVLVRPDGFVAWRAERGVDESGRILAGVLARQLGRRKAE